MFRTKLGSIRKTENFKYFCEIKLSITKAAVSSFVAGPGHFCAIMSPSTGKDANFAIELLKAPRLPSTPVNVFE